MESSTVVLYYIMRMGEIKFYTRLPPEGPEPDEDLIRVPDYLVQHIVKRGDEHELTLPDWFLRNANL